MTLKELEKLLRLCQKQGVKSIKMEGIELTLGDLPKPVTTAKRQKPQESVYDHFDPGSVPEPIPLVEETIPDDAPTEEQLLFGSSDPTVWETQQ